MKPEMSKLNSYDRQQVWKEYTQPIFERQTSINAALDLMRAHNLKWSMSDILLVAKRVQGFLETGDTSFAPKMDKYFELKQDQQLQELFAEHNKKDIEIL